MSFSTPVLQREMSQCSDSLLSTLWGSMSLAMSVMPEDGFALSLVLDQGELAVSFTGRASPPLSHRAATLKQAHSEEHPL